RFELLRLPQLRFELLALGLRTFAVGDIRRRAGHPNGLAICIAEALPAYLHPANLAGSRLNAILDLQSLGVPGQMVRDRVTPALDIGRMQGNARHPFLARIEDSIGGKAVDFFVAWRQVQRTGRDVPDPMPFMRAGHGEREAFFRFAQRHFRPLLCIDVAHRARHAIGTAAGVALTQATNAHPAIFAVVVAHPEVTAVERRTAGEVRLLGGLTAPPVFGVEADLRQAFDAWAIFRARRQAEDLLRACGEEDAIAIDVPVPQSLVGAGNRQGEALLAA